MTADGGKTEYKGAMRLPLELHGRLGGVHDLTGRSLNDLIVEAARFLCDLADSDDDDGFSVPEAVIASRAIRHHRKNPAVISLAKRYAKILRADSAGSIRSAEPPPGKKPQRKVG